jgi:hypothetical protein
MPTKSLRNDFRIKMRESVAYVNGGPGAIQRAHLEKVGERQEIFSEK